MTYSGWFSIMLPAILSRIKKHWEAAIAAPCLADGLLGIVTK